MIDLSDNTMAFGGRRQKIERWEVWFLTPFGPLPTLEEAIAAMTELELDCRIVIVPVAVAFSSDGHYEIFTYNRQ